MTSGRATRALPTGAAGIERARALHALCGLLLVCSVAGCSRDPVIVAGLQLDQNGGPDDGSGNGSEPPEAGAGGLPDDAGMAGAGGEAVATAGTGAAPSCEIDDPWFWIKRAIVRLNCKVRITDEDLLRALEEFQRNLPIVPSGEERMYEPCDYLAIWFYQNPEDAQEYIVCPSKCLLLKQDVDRETEEFLECTADAGSAP